MKEYRARVDTSLKTFVPKGGRVFLPADETPNPKIWELVGGESGQVAGAMPVSKADALKAEKEQARRVFETMGKNAELRLTKVSEIRQAYAKALDEARTMLTNAGVELGNEQDVDGLMALWAGVFVEQPADVVKK